MSGLFIRLAAQASGQRGATLHAPASLPYLSWPRPLDIDSPSPSFGPATGLEPSPAAVAGALHTPPRRAAGISPTHADIGPAGDDMAEPPFADAAMLSAGHHETADSAPLPRSRPAGPDAAHALAVPPVLLGAPVGTTEPVRQQQPDALIERELEPARQTVPTPAPGSARRSAPLASDASSDMDDVLAVPTTLLSPRSQPARQPAGPAAPAIAAAPPRQADEVHIHIGRIEVTAIQESAPSKRETRKGPAPLSLDDYLAKRKGDGR